MVCVACFIYPVVIFIWIKFIQPYVQPLAYRLLGWEMHQPFDGLACPLVKKKKVGESCQGTSAGDCEKDKSQQAPPVVEADKKSN